MQILALRDVYPLILAQLSVKDILNWCSTNRANRSLNTPELWRTLLLIRWGDVKGKIDPHLEYQQRLKLESITDVCFKANRCTTQTIDRSGRIIFDQIDVDTNDQYDAASGIFTTIIPGWYTFLFKGSINSSVEIVISVKLRKNNDPMITNISLIEGTRNFVVTQLLVYLSIGDEVDVFIETTQTIQVNSETMLYAIKHHY